jgi:hypothetical protein
MAVAQTGGPRVNDLVLQRRQAGCGPGSMAVGQTWSSGCGGLSLQQMPARCPGDGFLLPDLLPGWVTGFLWPECCGCRRASGGVAVPGAPDGGCVHSVSGPLRIVIDLIWLGGISRTRSAIGCGGRFGAAGTTG